MTQTVRLRLSPGGGAFGDTPERSQARAAADRGSYRRSKIWPVWKQVIGADQWWADLDSYRSLVVERFEEATALFASEVERTVQRISASG